MVLALVAATKPKKKQKNPILRTLSELPEEDKDRAFKLIVALMASSPFAAAGAAAVVILQWNLEHISIVKSKGKFAGFKRLSTAETSTLTNTNLTPISPPIMSLALRVGDAGADTAEAALQLAQEHIRTNQSRGLIGNISSFLFGGGG